MTPAVATDAVEAPDRPDIQVRPVRSGIVPDVWEHVEPMIRAAVAEGPGDETVADVLELIARRDYQLWLVLVDGQCKAAVVTTLANRARRRVCRIVYLGGDGIDQWGVGMVDALAEWARQADCGALEAPGRRGLAAVAKRCGAKAAWTVYRKELR